MNVVRRVAIVVGPGFELELEQAADDRPVWALRCPEYERVAEGRRSAARSDERDTGITLFDGSGLSPEAEAVEIFAVVDEHHGSHSRAPVREIEVLGAVPTPDVTAEVNACGFGDVSPSQRGFTARRRA